MSERIEGERELLGEIYFARLEHSRDCMDCLGSTVADQLLDKLANQKAAIVKAVEGLTRYGSGIAIGGRYKGEWQIQTQSNGRYLDRDEVLNAIKGEEE